jgi:2-C-methyl-D-erythritol 4-phosphate cytidylyltransferase
LLKWTLGALLEAAPLLATQGTPLAQILIAARREEFALIEPLVASLSPLITIVEGGATRQGSVFNAARQAQGRIEYYLVHDAARPLVSPKLIADVCRAAQKFGAALAACSASDTVKTTMEEEGVRFVASTLKRSATYLAQTPQVFRRDIFLRAFERASSENFEGTDCASLIERNGDRVVIVEGEITNFKITFAAEFKRAQQLLQERRCAQISV